MSEDDAVQIWWRSTERLDHAAIAAAVSVLSEDEAAQYRRFHFARDARDYAAAHALLRHTLSRHGDRAPAAWRFEKTAAGKPLLRGGGAAAASFSLSHTNGMVACALTGAAAVGVDIECVDRDVDVDTLAARFFAPAEAAQLRRLDAAARRDRFFDFWTLKEALVKALGAGLAMSLAAFAFTIDASGAITLEATAIEIKSWHFGLFAPGPQHRLAVAVTRAAAHAPPLILRSVADEA